MNWIIKHLLCDKQAIKSNSIITKSYLNLILFATFNVTSSRSRPQSQNFIPNGHNANVGPGPFIISFVWDLLSQLTNFS